MSRASDAIWRAYGLANSPLKAGENVRLRLGRIRAALRTAEEAAQGVERELEQAREAMDFAADLIGLNALGESWADGAVETLRAALTSSPRAQDQEVPMGMSGDLSISPDGPMARALRLSAQDQEGGSDG